MIILHSELSSPSHSGVPITRISAAFTFGQKISGQSSISAPCSRMSGCTPKAIRWSAARR